MCTHGSLVVRTRHFHKGKPLDFLVPGRSQIILESFSLGMKTNFGEVIASSRCREAPSLYWKHGRRQVVLPRTPKASRGVDRCTPRRHRVQMWGRPGSLERPSSILVERVTCACQASWINNPRSEAIGPEGIDHCFSTINVYSLNNAQPHGDGLT